MTRNTYRLEDFVYDANAGVHVHPAGDLTEYRDGGEDYVLGVLKGAADRSSGSRELLGRIKDWPSRYHLSYLRANLLEGIAELLARDSKVLEVGSGCGALTRWLGERFREVDALEGAFARAEATKARVKGLENVKVYCGDVFKTDLGVYDLITLIGVLEYAPQYGGGLDPRRSCTALLERCRKALDDRGILVLAIENKLGVKYLAGCTEDHTGKEYDGIMGYPNEGPATFSRGELEVMLEEAGFPNVRFYHPFPDYKLADVILAESDELPALRPYDWIRTPFEDYTGVRRFRFSEALALKSFTEAGLLWDVSNSFLVLASRSRDVDLEAGWLIKKFHNNTSLRSGFHHNTILEGKDGAYAIRRVPLPNGKKTIDFADYTFELSEASYVPGESLNHRLQGALFSKDPETAMPTIFKMLHDGLIEDYSLGKLDDEGFILVRGEAIDYTLWNVVRSDDGELHFIDRKWRCNGSLPSDYILFRNFYYIYDFIRPFLAGKPKSAFILENIKPFYPQYTEKRMLHDLGLEERFQSALRNDHVGLPAIDGPMPAMVGLTEGAAQKMLIEQQTTITELRESLARQRRYINEYRNVMLHEKALEMELAEIKGGIVWQLLAKYQGGVVERALPLRSRRRSYYDFALKSGRILLREGPAGLWQKYNAHREAARVEKEMAGNIAMTGPVKKYDVTRRNGEKLAFPTPERPLVSIVIPVHNNVDHTYSCLKSILENTRGAYEVIVVDDASDDDTPALLESVENIQKARNASCSGFIEACNRGAGLSGADYLLFLNNDTIVTEGWLEPLLALAAPDVGAVGSKLVYPDGRLQEAGGIVWNDASGHNYGRGDDPAKPEYNFVREVDYCSGAALLVRRELFVRLHGFDARFKPGYYEDVDLCFSIRGLGLRVLYQPASVVVHFEGATGGTDPAVGPKKYQAVNREKFRDKWSDTLRAAHYAPAAGPRRARSRGPGRNFLVIDQYVPHYDRDAGSIRMYNLMKAIKSLGHNVTFIGDNFAKFEPYTSNLQQCGIEAIYFPYIRSIESYLMLHGVEFDVVILSRSHIAIKHIVHVKKYCPGARIIFDTVDLQFVRESRRAEIEHNPGLLRDAGRSKMSEMWLANASDATLVVSPVEKEILLKEDPSLKVEVISLIQDTKGATRPFSARKDLMFLGCFPHMPNTDGALWFAREVFPLIRRRRPGIKLYLIGDKPPDEVQALACDDVVVTGYVHDLTPYFENCRAFVAPLRYGAGVKGKICESMGNGLPVVTTAIGAEGMGLKDGENAMIADDPAAFADKVARLYDDEALWQRLSAGSIECVGRLFSFEVAREGLRRIINETLEAPECCAPIVRRGA